MILMQLFRDYQILKLLFVVFSVGYCGVSVSPQRAYGQQPDVAEWIDDNAALVAHVGRLDRSINYLQGLSVFSNEKLQKADRPLGNKSGDRARTLEYDARDHLEALVKNAAMHG